MVMENSGLLVSTYVLTRFHLTFGIPTLLIVSYRGDFGDGNWWGASVGHATEPVLGSLGIGYEIARSRESIKPAIAKADKSGAASLAPTAVLLGVGCV
jgi:sulfopyruvate decarboxylase subunit alpha